MLGVLDMKAQVRVATGRIFGYRWIVIQRECGGHRQPEAHGLAAEKLTAADGHRAIGNRLRITAPVSRGYKLHVQLSNPIDLCR